MYYVGLNFLKSLIVICSDKMEHSRLVDVSGSDESDPERHMGSSNDSKTPVTKSNLKNVMVLLDCNVHKDGSETYMPDTKEMAWLKRSQPGQFKKDMKFTWDMTEEKVLKELRSHFPILRNNGR